MAHLKRQKVPKNWPTHRKGTAYVIRPNFSQTKGLPVLIVLRDILKVAQNKKEVKKALHLKHILLNNRSVIDEKNCAQLFDVLTIIPSKKHYRIELTENGKFKVSEIKESEAGKKIAKVINKKTLKDKKTQINLSDGRNFIGDIKCNTNDSVLINLKDKKIEKVLPLTEKAKVIVFAGKHSGEKGVINKINHKMKMADLSEKGKNVNVLIKQLMVVE